MSENIGKVAELEAMRRRWENAKGAAETGLLSDEARVLMLRDFPSLLVEVGCLRQENGRLRGAILTFEEHYRKVAENDEAMTLSNMAGMQTRARSRAMHQAMIDLMAEVGLVRPTDGGERRG